jgi:hypothetical protein
VGVGRATSDSLSTLAMSPRDPSDVISLVRSSRIVLAAQQVEGRPAPKPTALHFDEATDDLLLPTDQQAGADPTPVVDDLGDEWMMLPPTSVAFWPHPNIG